MKTLVTELSCTPKNSVKNLSPRVNRHGGSTNRLFIVQNYTDGGFGQWATDVVTCEQGHVDDERSCFQTIDDNEKTCGSPDHSRAAK